MTLPTITAIVVTYHTGPRLHECLYALKSDPDISEIIIVNNNFKDFNKENIALYKVI